MTTTGQAAREGSGSAFGVLLIVLGLVFLAGQMLGVDLRGIGWPLVVLLPGIGLVVVGLVGREWRPMLYAGAIATTVGALLHYQTSTGHWTSWAYAWALVAPGSVGLAQIVEGALETKGALVRDGIATLGAGIGLFAVGAAFFEGALGIGGRDFGTAGVNAFAIALIVVGSLVLVARMTGPRLGSG